MAEKKPTFYMMVGVPGSGKTTYARQIPNATVLSSDDIRAEIGADGGDKKMHKQVFDILHERTKEALSAGNDVVYDATNLRHTRRAERVPDDAVHGALRGSLSSAAANQAENDSL
ncbi:ATP-binding protein [Butyricicoccus sp. AM05-1]|uniref:ATP-binding protein n=1 Tax=Butyricicoccus sp. AM05-1 TaxID=2292004 RepID=UPI000E4DDE07|nr:ATP-binding protein [Butyricicoccus sp. AM05-1]RHO64992.1 ATP-binding protein [Butyricicoccus sp. AM05-1]